MGRSCSRYLVIFEDGESKVVEAHTVYEAADLIYADGNGDEIHSIIKLN